MKSMIASLCTLYSLSNAQPNIPQYVPINLPPIATTKAPNTPIVIDPAPPIQVPEFLPIDPLPVPEPPIVDPLPLPTVPGTPSTTAAAVLPNGQSLGAFGQTCEAATVPLCSTPTVGLLSSGIVSCLEPSSCCLCKYIECTNCGSFVAGDQAIFGVGAVTIDGVASGAQMVCQGLKSCSQSVVNARNVRTLAMTGVQASLDATITVTNPASDFKIECTSRSSCEGLKLEIVFEAPMGGAAQNCWGPPITIAGFQCSGSESCKNMQVTIRNAGCRAVLIENIECTTPDACLTAGFNLIGNVQIGNCDLGTSGHTTTGLDKCYQNLQALLCQEPGACRGIVKTLTNPARAFSMQCGDLSSCQASQITLNFDASPWYNYQTGVEFAEPTTWIEGFKFSGEASGAGAVITFNNQQRGKTLEIENIECAATNACAHTTFILGKDVEIVDVKCNPDACYNCLVKVIPTDPGTPCVEFMNI